jgi:hypothetical protein
MKVIHRTTACAAWVLIVASCWPAVTRAQGASPNVTEFATGLNNPRGLKFYRMVSFTLPRAAREATSPPSAPVGKSQARLAPTPAGSPDASRRSIPKAIEPQWQIIFHPARPVRLSARS